MPDARCTRDLVCNGRGSGHTSIQGSGGNPTFPAQWLYGLYVLSPVSGFLATVTLQILLQGLTPAPRRQDHTTSPYALVPFAIGTSSVHRDPSHVRGDHDTPP